MGTFVPIERPGAAPSPSRLVVVEPSRDPRANPTYKQERAKADAFIADNNARRKADPFHSGVFDAFVSSAGEPIPILDELIGGVKALGSAGVQAFRAAQGGPAPSLSRTQAVYLANKDAVNADRSARQAEHPVASLLGGFATPVGAEAKVAAVAPEVGDGLLSGAARWLKNGAKAGAVGAGYGAAYGASEGDGLQERAQNAVNSAKAGLLTGVALHGAGTAAMPVLKAGKGAVVDAARAVANIGKDPDLIPASPKQLEQAAKAVERLAARKGVTAERAGAIAEDKFAGKPVTAAELLGREGVSQLGMTARRGGATPDALEGTLRARQAGAPDRIMSDFENDLGVSPEMARGDVEAMVKQGREEAAPLYDEAYAVGGLNDPRLDTLTQRPSMQAAMSRARTIAAEEGRDPTELGFRTVQTASPETKSARMLTDEGKWVEKAYPTGNPGDLSNLSVQVEDPTAQTWDYVKRGLDDGLEAHRDPVSRRLVLDEHGRAKLETLNQFRSVLRDINPKYGEALDKSGDYLSLIDAMNTAKGKLTRGTVGDFGRAWASAKTPSAQTAFRAQIAQDVLDMANAGHLRGGKFAVPGIQQKLELAFGKDGAAKFIQRMDAEATLARNGQRMMPGNGSPTDELGAAGSEAASAFNDAARVGRAFSRGVMPGLWETVATGGRRALDYAKSAGVPVQVRDEYGRILMMQPEEFAGWLKSRGAQAPQVQVRPYLGAGIVGGSAGGRLAAPSAEYDR